MKERAIPIASATALASLVLYHYYYLRRHPRDSSDPDVPAAAPAQSSLSSTTITGATSAMQSCIYLDYNATTPVDPRVVQAMLPYLTTHFGNPSSSHAYGLEPKLAIQKARQAILELLYPHWEEKTRNTEEQDGIVFTGCGTEADNMAIHVAIHSQSHKINKKTGGRGVCHVVTTNVEHPAVAQYLDALEKQGKIQVTRIPVNQEGCVVYEDVIQGIRLGETVLVTIMLANNESGALQPVKQIAEYCRRHGILFHTDAAQAVGKVSVALDETGIGDCVDMVTIVGHKFGAPKGIACLYIRPGCLEDVENGISLKSSDYLLIGGGQEGGKRAGTENVPYIVGLGAAASILMARTKTQQFCWQENASRMEYMRSRLLNQLVGELGDVIVRPNGPKDENKRLPNTLSVGFRNVHSGELLNRIQMSVACSAGSACHSSGDKVSSVLQAMNVPMEYARGTLRLSVGPDTNEEDVDTVAKIIVKEVMNELQLQSS